MLDLDYKGKVNQIISRYNSDKKKIINIIQEVQKEYRYLPEEVLVYIADTLDITHSKIYGIATFYENFSLEEKGKNIIKVCAGTGCVAGGSLEIYEKIKGLIEEEGLLVDIDLEKEEEGIGVKKSGCHGFCEAGPLVRIEPLNYLYLHVKKEDCEEIVSKTLKEGKPIHRLMYKSKGEVYETQEEIPFYEKQTRLVLHNCGHIDAESIQEYISHGGYKAAAMTLTMDQKDVCQIIIDSGLRGRGG